MRRGRPACTSQRHRVSPAGCGPVAAALAVSQYLGIDGYQKLVKKCLNNTQYLQGKIEGLGLSLVTKPVMNVLAIKLKNPRKVFESLCHMGWKVNNMERLSAVRIVVMPHVTKKVIDCFIPDLRRACKQAGEL